MPKLSEIELRPNDIRLSDVPDDLIERLQARAMATNVSFSEYVLTLMADHFETSREGWTSGTVIVLDPE